MDATCRVLQTQYGSENHDLMLFSKTPYTLYKSKMPYHVQIQKKTTTVNFKTLILFTDLLTKLLIEISENTIFATTTTTTILLPRNAR